MPANHYSLTAHNQQKVYEVNIKRFFFLACNTGNACKRPGHPEMCHHYENNCEI